MNEQERKVLSVKVVARGKTKPLTTFLRRHKQPYQDETWLYGGDSVIAFYADEELFEKIIKTQWQGLALSYEKIYR